MRTADIKIIILDQKRTNKSFIGDTLGNIKKNSIKRGVRVIPRRENWFHPLAFTPHVTPCLSPVNWVKAVYSRLP